MRSQRLLYRILQCCKRSQIIIYPALWPQNRIIYNQHMLWATQKKHLSTVAEVFFRVGVHWAGHEVRRVDVVKFHVYIPFPWNTGKFPQSSHEDQVQGVSPHYTYTHTVALNTQYQLMPSLTEGWLKAEVLPHSFINFKYLFSCYSLSHFSRRKK